MVGSDRFKTILVRTNDPLGLVDQKDPHDRVFRRLFYRMELYTKCSFKLMNLIAAHEENTLVKINEDNKQHRESFNTFSHTSIYEDLNVKLQETVEKLENYIMETKRLKLLRDIQDYNEKYFRKHSAPFKKKRRQTQA